MLDEADIPGSGLRAMVGGAFVALFLRFGGIVVNPEIVHKQPVSP